MIRTAGQKKDTVSTQLPFKKFPGISATADGAGAAVWVESHVSQAACSFPVHPARAMQEAFADLAAAGSKNLWNQPLESVSAESPADAASFCEGFALTGGRATSFASGQSLPAMTEVLATIAGKRLPMVFHVGARALQSQASATRAGHDDIMSVADAGWGIVFARDPQEVADLALVARRAAEYAETPFFVVQDAYATTHQIRDILLPELEFMRLFVDEAEAKLKNYFNPRRPAMLNPVQDDEDYMAGRMAQRGFFSRVEAALEASMAEFSRLTGRTYNPVDGYRMEDAEHVLLGCGSMMENCERAVDYLRAHGMRVGALTIRAFRPFPSRMVADLLKGRASVTVLERTDTPLAPSNPLAMAVSSALASLDVEKANLPRLIAAVAGLGTIHVEKSVFISAAENAALGSGGKPTLVLEQLAVHTMPPERTAPAIAGTGMAICRSGGEGAVYANRLIAAITRDLFGLRIDADGYTGTEKVGSPVVMRLAAAAGPDCPCAIESPRKLVVVDSAGLLHTSNPVAEVMDGGVLFCPFAQSLDAVWKVLPAKAKKEVQERKIRIAGLDANRVQGSKSEDLGPFVRADLLALGAWLRISPYLRESKMEEQAVYHRMTEILSRMEPSLSARQTDAIYDTVKSTYLSMLRFATPEEPVEIPVSRSLPVLGAPAPATEEDDNFCEQIIGTGACPNRGDGYRLDQLARAQAEPAQALVRSFRNDAAEIPLIDMERCIGCMECVAVCPDVAILGRVVEESVANERLASVEDTGLRSLLGARFGKTRRYYDSLVEKNQPGGMLALFVDVDRCKGCGECVDACGDNNAITMAAKEDMDLSAYDAAMALYRSLPDTPERFLSERALGDILLSQRSQLAVGGSGSCAGCGQSTAVRLMLASTGFQFGGENVGVVAASGCDSVYGAVFPYNPYKVPWTNTLSGNAPADALGIRRRWNKEGHSERKLWVLGSIENFGGAGLSALTSLLASGEDVNVLVLDSQIFDTESRRIHSAGFVSESRANRKAAPQPALAPTQDLAQLGLLFPNVFVAQTTVSHLNHFHKSIRAANEYRGPALIVCYATCMAEDGVSEDKALAQAKLAVESRAFPLLTCDPRNGDTLRDRLNLQGNPAMKEDWYTPREGTKLDLIGFAKTEDRFLPYFDGAGGALPSLEEANTRSLARWRRLQELAGIR